MKIYESVEAVPSRVLALLRLLESCAPVDIPQSDAMELLQPRPIRTKETADNMSKETISAAIELELVEEAKTAKRAKSLRLTSSLQKTKDDRRSQEERFYSVLCRQVMRPTIGGKENRFANIVAWILCQPPGTMPRGHTGLKTAFDSQGMGCSEHGVQSDARWDNVIYWARYIGFVSQLRSGRCEGIVSDPSSYIGRNLLNIFPKTDPLPAVEFRKQLGRICPVIDGGLIHKKIAGKIRGLEPLAEDQFTGALSFGLRHLKRRGIIDYECPDDARTFLRTDQGEKIAFVRRKET